MPAGLIAAFILLMLINGCEDEPEKPKPNAKQEIVPPLFNPDSAYNFVQQQVNFGPRVPNTPGHAGCGEWLVQKMRNYGASVTVQQANAKAFDGTVLNMKNIIAAFNPEAKKRILLCAHWDTRPFADKDSIKTNWNTPIDGANDGGSGVAVMLELARMFQIKPPPYGVDIILFDAEDYGKPEFIKEAGAKDNLTWCLGSQYWAKNPHKGGYAAKFGILLDMVGARDATFYREGYSMEYAPHIVNKVWESSKKFGYQNFFLDDDIGGITDDHVAINEIAGIPTINIIQYDKSPKVMGFGFYHHTHRDNMSVIDAATLKAVGEVVAWVVYNE